MSKPYTKKELEKINYMIEEALLFASGVLPLEKVKTDTTKWTKKEFEAEIERITNQIKTNQNAFGVPKIKVKNNVKTKRS